MPSVPGNHVHPPLPPSRLQVIAPLASRRVAKAIMVSLIHSRLIDVDPMRRLGVKDLSYERAPFCVIALEVAVGLFFRVQLILFSAREIVRRLISLVQSSAISAWVFERCCSAKTRNAFQFWIFL